MDIQNGTMMSEEMKTQNLLKTEENQQLIFTDFVTVEMERRSEYLMDIVCDFEKRHPEIEEMDLWEQYLLTGEVRDKVELDMGWVNLEDPYSKALADYWKDNEEELMRLEELERYKKVGEWRRTHLSRKKLNAEKSVLENKNAL
jgi:hypothetical protein